MFLETLSDFFLFLSTDKKFITQKNLFDFDILINQKKYLYDSSSSNLNANNQSQNSNTTPNQMTKPLRNLLQDFLLFLYNNKKIYLSSKAESEINQKLDEFSKKQNNPQSDFYQEQYKKTNLIKKEREKETKNKLVEMLRQSEFDIRIDPVTFISFFNNSSNKHKNTVKKFLYKIRAFVNERSKTPSVDGNLSGDDVEKSRSELDKSNPNNKSSVSGISDKDGTIQDKEKFLEVLNKVKNKVNHGNNNNNTNNTNKSSDEGSNDDNKKVSKKKGKGKKNKASDKSIDINDVKIKIGEEDFHLNSNRNNTDTNINTQEEQNHKKENSPCISTDIKENSMDVNGNQKSNLTETSLRRARTPEEEEKLDRKEKRQKRKEQGKCCIVF